MVLPTVAFLRGELSAGRVTSLGLLEQALAKIHDVAGEGSRAFMKVYEDTARAEAAASDRLRAAGIVRSPIDGVPVSVKDLFDVSGDVTRAGSTALAKVRPEPAAADAPAVARLRAAGAVIVGRSATVEFAFGGVGTNPHYGTPRNPYDRSRVPGGSSSGAAVSVADEMCVMGLGSDTRGSVRIPAALCGVTGFKPTQSRVPRDGCFPLSYTLDSVGPLCRSVACCATFDAILSGSGPTAEAAPLEAPPLGGLRLLCPESDDCFLFQGLDETVAAAFARSVATLEAGGARVSRTAAPVLGQVHALYEGGGFAAPEAAQIHRPILATHAHEYDPNIATRIAAGESFAAADYIELGFRRQAAIAEVGRTLAQYDALICPTTPCVAPTIAEAQSCAETYTQINLRLLRNTGLVNMMDGCAVSLPCHVDGELPVGLMVVGPRGSDRRILGIAQTIEGALASTAAAPPAQRKRQKRD